MSTDLSSRPNLNVLVCDPDPTTSSRLTRELRTNPLVSTIELATSVAEAETHLQSNGCNTIFIDPLSLGLDSSANFIFKTRETHSHIVFVLFFDRAAAESRRTEFYSGPRSRFLHYFTVDKGAPVATFANEIAAVLERCQQYLGFTIPVQQLKEISEQASELVRAAPGNATPAAIEELASKLDELLSRLPPQPSRSVRKNTVFLSCRFAESQYIEGLRELLTDRDFEVVMGDNASGYVSDAILERIRESEFFVCLMTRDKEKVDGTYTTSPWLLEEKGAALALGKYLVLLIEEGVTDFGGLQGDWQRHYFSPKSFINAALNAARQLRSASGKASL